MDVQKPVGQVVRDILGGVRLEVHDKRDVAAFDIMLEVMDHSRVEFRNKHDILAVNGQVLKRRIPKPELQRHDIELFEPNIVDGLGNQEQNDVKRHQHDDEPSPLEELVIEDVEQHARHNRHSKRRQGGELPDTNLAQKVACNIDVHRRDDGEAVHAFDIMAGGEKIQDEHA